MFNRPLGVLRNHTTCQKDTIISILHYNFPSISFAGAYYVTDDFEFKAGVYDYTGYGYLNDVHYPVFDKLVSNGNLIPLQKGYCDIQSRPLTLDERLEYLNERNEKDALKFNERGKPPYPSLEVFIKCISVFKNKDVVVNDEYIHSYFDGCKVPRYKTEITLPTVVLNVYSALPPNDAAPELTEHRFMCISNINKNIQTLIFSEI